MKTLVEYIARSLVSEPDKVEVIEEHRGDRIIIHLRVADDDKGRVIGRDGRCANAIRSLLHVAAVRSGVRASLDID
jgi:predicted RNA-binding protein YlqC (UPF0109 family)